jgi:hypothetical protein
VRVEAEARGGEGRGEERARELEPLPLPLLAGFPFIGKSPASTWVTDLENLTPTSVSVETVPTAGLTRCTTGVVPDVRLTSST